MPVHIPNFNRATDSFNEHLYAEGYSVNEVRSLRRIADIIAAVRLQAQAQTDDLTPFTDLPLEYQLSALPHLTEDEIKQLVTNLLDDWENLADGGISGFLRLSPWLLSQVETSLQQKFIETFYINPTFKELCTGYATFFFHRLQPFFSEEQHAHYLHKVCQTGISSIEEEIFSAPILDTMSGINLNLRSYFEPWLCEGKTTTAPVNLKLVSHFSDKSAGQGVCSTLEHGFIDTFMNPDSPEYRQGHIVEIKWNGMVTPIGWQKINYGEDTMIAFETMIDDQGCIITVEGGVYEVERNTTLRGLSSLANLDDIGGWSGLNIRPLRFAGDLWAQTIKSSKLPSTHTMLEGRQAFLEKFRQAKQTWEIGS